MKKVSVPVYWQWSHRRTAASSLVLAIVGLLVVRLLETKHHSHETGGLHTFANLLEIWTVVIALAAPPLIVFMLTAWRRLRPRPGALAFDKETRHSLRQSFDVDRNSIKSAMVPRHTAKAKPARGVISLNLGDARLVLSPTAQRQVTDFVRKPQVHSTRRDEQIACNVLVVTGEPGAGKSVMLQEIHESLSTGVEEGHHSFVPLFVFARYLTLESLNEACQTIDSPMQGFLVSYYERQSKAAPGNERLLSLLDLVTAHWSDTDFLVIIDGLDEIAQRSAYEPIQQKLVEVISADLDAQMKTVHRFILSCRIDEDIGFFHGAGSLFLSGLTDDELTRFCDALIRDAGLDKQGTTDLREGLRSSQVMPTHVFRRNPYFLSLLIWYIEHEQDKSRERPINFDVLMRKYIEREATREFASADGDTYVKRAERSAVLQELEKVSRACLQYLAFRSASSAKAGALYDEVPIDRALLNSFVASLESSSIDADTENPWSILPDFIEYLASSDRPKEIGPEAINRFSGILHENDIRLLNSLANGLLMGGELDNPTLQLALGTIPYHAKLETFAWYATLLEKFRNSIAETSLNLSNRISALLLLRSIAAAHALRILLVNTAGPAIAVRLRHRRLAEYYAGCYARNRWTDLVQNLQFTPWLGPVLNLTCALESAGCKALRWLVEQIDDRPREPYYKWRYSLEAAVEASLFAHPGPVFEDTMRMLLTRTVSVLTLYGKRPLSEVPAGKAVKPSPTVGTLAGQVDDVTLTTLLRAIEQMVQLSDTSTTRFLGANAVNTLYDYEASLPAVWISSFLPVRAAIEKTSGRSSSPAQTVSLLLKLVQQPSAILFFPFRTPWKGLVLAKVLVWITTLLGEVCMDLLVPIWISSVPLSVFLLLGFSDSDAVGGEGLALMFVMLSCSVILLRILSWRRSKTNAASYSTLPWRIVIGLIRGVFRIVRVESFAEYTGRNLASLRRMTAKRSLDFSRLIAETLLALALVCAILVGATAFLARESVQNVAPASGPCDVVSTQVEAIRAFAKSTPRGDAEIARIRQELRQRLGEVERANHGKDCGGEVKGSLRRTPSQMSWRHVTRDLCRCQAKEKRSRKYFPTRLR